MNEEQLRLKGLSEDEIAGFLCYVQDESPSDPQNESLMRGWVIGWGYTDRRLGMIACFPTNPEYQRGYNLSKFEEGKYTVKVEIQFELLERVVEVSASSPEAAKRVAVSQVGEWVDAQEFGVEAGYIGACDVREIQV